MNDPEVGARVIAASVNPDYDGEVGTVVQRLGEFFYVDFDFVGKPGDDYANGGTWDATNLTVVETAEVAELKAEVAAHEANYASLADDYRTAKAAAEALADEAEYLRKAWRYALTLLDERSKDRANGYYDALLDERLRSCRICGAKHTLAPCTSPNGIHDPKVV